MGCSLLGPGPGEWLSDIITHGSHSGGLVETLPAGPAPEALMQ